MSVLMGKKRSETDDTHQTPQPTGASPARAKLNIDVDPVIRQALGLRASKLTLERLHEVPIYEVVDEILRRELAAEISRIQAARKSK